MQFITPRSAPSVGWSASAASASAKGAARAAVQAVEQVAEFLTQRELRCLIAASSAAALRHNRGGEDTPASSTVVRREAAACRVQCHEGPGRLPLSASPPMPGLLAARRGSGSERAGAEGGGRQRGRTGRRGTRVSGRCAAAARGGGTAASRRAAGQKASAARTQCAEQ